MLAETLPLNQQKEEFSFAYVHSVVSKAGYCINYPRKDRGIDINVYDSNEIVKLDIQVKCRENEILHGNNYHVSLKAPHYNKLCVPQGSTSTDRILVVVFVPNNCDDWCYHTEEELILRRCGYWLSLQGKPKTSNTSTKTICIPKQNVFNVEALKNMMDNIAKSLHHENN